MKKIYIEVSVPVTGEVYELLVPKDIPIDKLTKLFQNFLSNRLDSAFLSRSDSYLHDGDTGRVLNQNLTAEQIGLYTGKKLFFV